MGVVANEGLTEQGIFFRHYKSNKNSVPLVLVMGYGGSLNAWPLSFIGQLSSSQDIVIFDNRGTGRSRKITSNFSVCDLAKDLQELLEYLEIPQINLLGYSLGGCIALHFTHENADKIGRLILMSSTAGGKYYTSPGENTLQRLLNPQGSTKQEMFLDTFKLCLSDRNREKYEQELVQIFAASSNHLTPRETLASQFKAYKDFSAETFLSKIRRPVKIIHGLNDRLTPIDNAKMLAEHLKNAELVIIDDCEHCPHIEQQERVLKEIGDFSS